MIVFINALGEIWNDFLSILKGMERNELSKYGKDKAQFLVPRAALYIIRRVYR
jgi:hypothetical protein